MPWQATCVLLLCSLHPLASGYRRPAYAPGKRRARPCRVSGGVDGAAKDTTGWDRWRAPHVLAFVQRGRAGADGCAWE